MPASPNLTLTFNFEALTGTANGYATLQLSGFRQVIPKVSGGVLSNVFYSTAPANITAAVTIFNNTIINPATTFYLVSIFNEDGVAVQQNVPYYFSATGTVDFSTLTPLSEANLPIPTPPFTTVPASEFYGSAAIGTGSAPPTYRSIDGQDIDGILGTIYLGGDNVQFGASADMGAQINAAYAALPAGGRIAITPKSDGSPYQYSTPIVLATAGKYVVLEGIGVGASQATFNSIPQGTVLQFTPVSGDAITLDYVPVSAAGWNGRHGIHNLTLIANTLTIYGGTVASPNTSTSRGVVVGNTNEGCIGAEFHNLDIRGFSTNFFVSNQISWGLSFYNLTSMFSKHGIHIQDIELCTFINPKFVYNLVAMEASSQVTILGGSIDQNGGETSGSNQTSATSAAIVDISGSAFAPDLTIVGTHFEQGQGVTPAQNPMQLVNFTTGVVRIIGGQGLDNITSGSSQNWFVAPIVSVEGLFNAFSGGRTGIVAVPTTTGYASIYNAAPSHITTTNGNNITDISVTPTGSPTKTFFGNVNSSTGFQIGGGAVIGAYATGAWTPTATNLTQAGGSATLTGQYTQIGKMVMWQITITPATSTSSTAGSTTFSFPPSGAATAVPAGYAFAATDLTTFSANGVVTATAIDAPSWSTKTSPVYMTGVYMVP